MELLLIPLMVVAFLLGRTAFGLILMLCLGVITVLLLIGGMLADPHGRQALLVLLGVLAILGAYASIYARWPKVGAAIVIIVVVLVIIAIGFMTNPFGGGVTR